MSEEKELKRTSQATLMRTLETLLLLDSPYGITVDELHRHFLDSYGERTAPSKRTIYRYIQSLMAANFYIEKTDDRFKVYLNHSELDFKKILQCSREESLILAKAMQMVEGDHAVKQKLAQKLEALSGSGKEPLADEKKEESENILRLTGAISNRNPVILKNYRSANSKTIRDRKVEPFGFTYRRAYIWAFDTEDKKNKLFSTSRLSGVEILDAGFMYSDEHKKGETDIFRIAGFKPVNIQLKLTLRAYNLLLEEYPLAEKDIEKLANGEYLLTTKVCGFEGVGRFITGLPGDVKVISPAKLKDFVVGKVKMLLE